MTERGWTKGPWYVDGNRISPLIRHDFGKIASVMVSVDRSIDKTDANANLIVAAPDLYEALEELFNEIAAEAYPQRLRPALSKAAEAMLKAIGKS